MFLNSRLDGESVITRGFKHVLTCNVVLEDILLCHSKVLTSNISQPVIKELCHWMMFVGEYCRNPLIFVCPFDCKVFLLTEMVPPEMLIQ